MRPLKEWSVKGKECTVSTERPGAVRSVVYREAMVVLGAEVVTCKLTQ